MLSDFPCAQVRAEEIGHSKKVFKLTCNGVGLDKKDLFGKSDPYLELARENPDGSYTKVCKTNVRASLCVASVCVWPLLNATFLYCLLSSPFSLVLSSINHLSSYICVQIHDRYNVNIPTTVNRCLDAGHQEHPQSLLASF